MAFLFFVEVDYAVPLFCKGGRKKKYDSGTGAANSYSTSIMT